MKYSLGIESTTGRLYASIPVSNGIVDYEEYYEITPEQFQVFSRSEDAAIEFADAGRRREHHDLLTHKPGRFRGTPR